MKKFAIAILFAIAFVYQGGNETFARSVTEESQVQQQESTQWAELGWVKARVVKKGYGYTDPIDVKLYVMQLGKKILYRVSYNGENYTVHKDENDNAYNAWVSINDKTYYFDVPTW